LVAAFVTEAKFILGALRVTVGYVTVEGDARLPRVIPHLFRSADHSVGGVAKAVGGARLKAS
jgi:hypothetical protein